MWRFKRSSISKDVRNWIEDSFAWAQEHGLTTQQTPLVTLSKEFFTAPALRSHEEAPVVVEALISDIKNICGIPDHEIDVVAIPSLAPEYSHSYQSTSETAATWSVIDGRSTISFNTQLLGKPSSLISALVHEVLHHILHCIEEYPPGGPEAEEISTDLMAIFMGFGAVQLNGAEQAGWQGYLRQDSRAYALAYFAQHTNKPVETVLETLVPRCKKTFKHALRALESDV